VSLTNDSRSHSELMDEDGAYRDFLRAELNKRARQSAPSPNKRIFDVLLTLLFLGGIILVVLHQNGMFGK
jgi:hypothetical protein